MTCKQKKLLFEKKKELNWNKKKYTKQKIIVFDKNATSIIDWKIKFKATNSTWLTEKIKKTKTKKNIKFRSIKKKDGQNNKNIIDDTVNNLKLQNAMMKNNDFVIFKKTDNDKNVQHHLKMKERYFFHTIKDFLT